MFPHVNLCPLLERHLRPRAETKGLITPDAALGRGRRAGGREGGPLHTALSGAMASCFFVIVVRAFFSPLPFSILTTKPWMKSLRSAQRPPRPADLGKLWPRRGDSPAARGVLWIWGVGARPVLRDLRSPKCNPRLRLRRLGPPANLPNSLDIPRSRCARK